jgi:hypothetical protein
MSQKWKEGIDYYYDEHGRWVFTAHYLLKRGYCCKSGCKHCPYGFHENAKKKDKVSEKKGESNGSSQSPKSD